MKQPNIDNSALVLPGAVVVGDVELGPEATVWYHAVVRGDEAPIKIGARTNIQDCAVVHVDVGVGVTIGEGVTVGHNAILHGCEIGDNTLVGMGAIVLNGAKIGKNCIVGAGALVTQNTVVPDGSMVLGSPARIKRALTEAEMEQTAKNAAIYVDLIKTYRDL